MLKYDPKDAVLCWPEGDYDMTLDRVEDTISKSSGNDMQVWHWTAYTPDGREQTIKDYVVIPAATFKIKQLARALGLEDEFKAGKFQADNHVGCSVVGELIVESQDGYDDKNKVGKVKAKADSPMPSAPPMQPGTMQQQLKERPAPEPPFSEEQQVAADDIPF